MPDQPSRYRWTIFMSVDQMMILADCMTDVGFAQEDTEFYKQLADIYDINMKAEPDTFLRIATPAPGKPQVIGNAPNVGFESVNEIERVVGYLNDSNRHDGTAAKVWVTSGLNSLLESCRTNPGLSVAMQ